MRYAKETKKDTVYTSVNQLIQLKNHSGPSVIPPRHAPLQAKSGLSADSIPRPVGHTGLPDNLKTGVENLSGFSMNDVQVHYNSAKPAQLQALAYTRGTEIHIAPGQERHLPHEAWHVVQQKQGRVRPTLQPKGLGVEVNNDAGLEQEADEMGSKVTGANGVDASFQLFREGMGSEGTHSQLIRNPSPLKAGNSDSFPIQRRISKFKCESDDCDPPTNDLLETIDYRYFKEPEADVRDAITGALTPTRAAVTDRPNEIKATIGKNGKNDSNPERKTNKSGQVGKFGSNEYFLRAGGAYEVFEGGHLIPHELWSERDPDVACADDYVNLVPMSRTMNVGAVNSWRTIEKQMLEFVENLKGKENFEVVIKVNHENYRLSYNQLAGLFKLHVDSAKHDGTDSIVLYNWLPTSFSAVKNPTKATEVDMGEITESQIHNTSARISTGGELIEVLKSTPIWNRMSVALQDKVEKI